MHSLRLLDGPQTVDAHRRRSFLYVVAFAALALAVEANASALTEAHREPSVFFFALVAAALLSGVLALIVSRGARLSQTDLETAVNDEQTKESIALLRARRSNRLPPIELHALLPTSDNTPAELARPHKAAAQPNAKPEAKLDPWSRILDDVSQAAGKRGKGRKSK